MTKISCDQVRTEKNNSTTGKECWGVGVTHEHTVHRRIDCVTS